MEEYYNPSESFLKQKDHRITLSYAVYVADYTRMTSQPSPKILSFFNATIKAFPLQLGFKHLRFCNTFSIDL